MNEFAQKTIEIFRSTDWGSKIDAEVNRLLRSGAFSDSDHNRALVIGVALENLADNYMRDMRKSTDYKNAKRF